MSLAKLGDFSFIMNESHFKQMNETFAFDFAKHKRLSSSESFQDVGGYSHEITLKGLLVAKKSDTLASLIARAKNKERLLFTTFEHNINVVITTISRGKDKFVPNGKFMTQSFSIHLKKVF